jgi:hypothetical protein
LYDLCYAHAGTEKWENRWARHFIGVQQLGKCLDTAFHLRSAMSASQPKSSMETVCITKAPHFASIKRSFHGFPDRFSLIHSWM